MSPFPCDFVDWNCCTMMCVLYTCIFKALKSCEIISSKIICNSAFRGICIFQANYFVLKYMFNVLYMVSPFYYTLFICLAFMMGGSGEQAPLYWLCPQGPKASIKYFSYFRRCFTSIVNVALNCRLSMSNILGFVADLTFEFVSLLCLPFPV